MALSSIQKGNVIESHVANLMMLVSDGELASFWMGCNSGLVPPKWTHQLCCHGSFRKDKPFVIHGTQVPV